MGKFKFPLWMASLWVLLIVLSGPSAYAQRKVTILHTNDLHSSLMEEDIPTGPYGTVGGFSRIAGIIHEQSTGSNNPVFTMDAGDFLMGSLFQVLESRTGFQLHLMKEMGYDVVALGNHEFDFGIDSLVNYAERANALGSPVLLNSNIGNKICLHEGYSGLLKQEIIKPYHIIEKDGIRIGVFSLVGREAFRTAPNAHILSRSGSIKTARKIVKKLKKEEDADLVICLSHGGVYHDDKGNYRNKEDIRLAKKVRGIDAIISGHTHSLLEEPILVDGTPIIQVQDKGQFVGKLSLDLDNKDFLEYELIPVSRECAPDLAIASKIEEQYDLVKEFVQNEAKIAYDSSYFETEFMLSRDDQKPEEANIGGFIADAMHYYVNKYDSIGTHITLIAQGFIREEIQPGMQSLEGIFEVTSLGTGYDQLPGYPLSRFYFTAEELKRMLEFVFIAGTRDPSYYCFFSGIRIDINPDGGLLNKISAVYLADENNAYHPLDCSKDNRELYAFTTDKILVEFFTEVRKMSYGLIRLNPKHANGEIVKNIQAALIDIDPYTPGIQEAKIWKSVLEYGCSFTDVNENGIPDLPDTYRRTDSDDYLLPGNLVKNL
ncbi:MAG: metallophosphoesterase [Bacteroidales bacterium]|nr:metallophosphoesterase [Bacteroidales bacterium]